MTRQGRIAILTNFREDDQVIVEGARSRGEMPLAYLKSSKNSEETPEDFVARMVAEDGLLGIGGFSLMFGQIQGRDGARRSTNRLGVISNRTSTEKGVVWLFEDGNNSSAQTYALSNSHFGDLAWPKVVDGERLVQKTVLESAEKHETQEQLLARLFVVLSNDTLPKEKPGEDWTTFVKELRKSILIPPIGGSDTKAQSAEDIASADAPIAVSAASHGVYGTQKQTVILVDNKGKTTFVERTLYDGHARRVSTDQQDRRFDFQIEDWKG